MGPWGWVILGYLCLAAVCIAVFHQLTKTAPFDPNEDDFAGFQNTDLLFAPTEPTWDYDENSDTPLHADGSGSSECLPSRPSPDSTCTAPYHGSISYARTYACSCNVCKYLRGHGQ